MFDMNSQTNAIMQNQMMLNSYFSNLQNQFTPGYKPESVNFNDIYSQAMGSRGAQAASSGIVFTQGNITRTNNPTDLALNGNGFFAVTDGGRTHYTRDGRFAILSGQMTHQSTGMVLEGFALDTQGNRVSEQKAPIKLDLDPATGLYNGQYTGYHFDQSGKLYGETAIQDPITKQVVVSSVPIYQVAVASFANPSGLAKSGSTTFTETMNSGQAVVGVSGQGALGQVQPQSLEMATVDFAQQSAAIGMARQNYNANFAAFRAMDQLTQSAIGLIR